MRPGPSRPRVSQRDEEARRHLERAQALERAGDVRGAAREYDRVAGLQPRNVGALARLGFMLRMLDEIDEARKVLERAVKVDPRHAESHLYLALIRKYDREPERALESLERAMWAAPRDVRAHVQAFGVYEQLDRLDDAERVIRKALGLVPDHERCVALLGRLHRRRGEPAKGVEVLRGLLRRRIADETRQYATFELARSLDAIGDYDGAFAAFGAANEIQSRSPMARAVDDRQWLKLIGDSHAFTEEHFARWKADGPADDGPGPLFLLGFPRSGTTLTEHILGAHPDVGVSDERDLFSPMYRAMFPDWNDQEALLPQLERVPRELLAKGRRVYREQTQRLLRRERGATVLLDKSPMNIVALGVISRVFPDARVIVAIRDPREVCLSCFFQEFTPNASNNYFFTPGGTLEMYRRVMDLWLAQRAILKLDVFECRYEDTTGDFERQARRLIGFAGLAWDDAVLAYHEARKNKYVSTPSFEGVASPVHTRARGKWRNYEKHLGPMLEGLRPYVRALGYEGEG